MSGRILGVAALLVTAMIALLFWERNPAPHAELDILRREVDESIQRSNADLYAPESAVVVRDSLASLQHEMERQLRRLPFLRRYHHVHRGMTNLRERLGELEEEARRQHDDLARRVAERIVRAHDEADALEAAIATAPRTKDGSSILRILDDELFEIRELLLRAKRALEDGHVVSAQREAAAARARTAELMTEVRDAETVVSEPNDGSP